MVTAAASAPADAAARRGLFFHRDFRRLWIGDAISQVGTQISLLALPLVAVKTLHASAFEVGALTACETAAFLLVGLPAGAWCDRVRRRPVLILGDVGRAIALGSVPLAALLHGLTIGQLFVVALVMGVLTATFGGVIRDVLAHEPSVLLRRELYVTPALAGATAFVALEAAGVLPLVAGFAGFCIAFGVRAGAIVYGWKLPAFRGPAPPEG